MVGICMLRQHIEEISVPTQGRGFYEITGDLAARIRQASFQAGLATLHIRHTSASLVIQENADPEVRRDLERFCQKIVPDGDPIFEHTAEGDDDMPAHVRTALTSVNLSIPIHHGQMTLGTWQGIYLWEHRKHPHRRKIVLHLIGE